MAFIVGYILDLLIGDPINFPHPVRWIGGLITKLTNVFLKQDDSNAKKRFKGFLLSFIVILITILVSCLILWLSYTINSYFGIIIESVMTYQCLATKSLYTESMKVYKALNEQGLEAGRKAVSMIVGRDTDQLDETGVIKATIETVAENTSDGVIAPMLYLCIGGPILGMTYKAINTMDSMIGYKSDKYIDFGRFAAKFDDIANYLPSRISAYLMILTSFIMGKRYNTRNAIYIFKRDRYNHASPNSAQTESVCAGALDIKLAGPATYFGKFFDKPFIGDSNKEVELKDIKRINVLMMVTSLICQIILSLVMILVFFCLKII